jgi:hypothetical protein
MNQTHSLGTGVLCPPLENTHRRSLDQIIIKLSPLTSRAEVLLAQSSPSVEALLQLQVDLLALNDEIVYWPDDRPSVWNPKLVGYVSLPGFCFSGPVEEYFDRKLDLCLPLYRRLPTKPRDSLCCDSMEFMAFHTYDLH